MKFSTAKCLVLASLVMIALMWGMALWQLYQVWVAASLAESLVAWGKYVDASLPAFIVVLSISCSLIAAIRRNFKLALFYFVLAAFTSVVLGEIRSFVEVRKLQRSTQMELSEERGPLRQRMDKAYKPTSLYNADQG
ncbi:MAG: hypothetical protein KDD62_06425 [Bdellovibrionales bacterium]|nr:hypothetical protein [Bdellovibrionales bacterium]